MNTHSTIAQSTDFDGDLIADSIDIDDDNDGIPDNTEKYPNCESSFVYNWVTWIHVNNTLAQGKIFTPTKTINVTVTHSVGGMIITGVLYNRGIFPSNYNIRGNNMQLANTKAGTLTVTFSEPVSNPLFAFSSIGDPSLSVPIVTSTPYSVVWPGYGITYVSPTQFTGQDGYNFIQFPQVNTTFSFDYQATENYCNIVIGGKDLLNCSGNIEDTDNDGMPNHLDLDSDNDGCSDALESGATTNNTPNFTFTGPFGSNGLADNLELSVDAGSINYLSTYNYLALNYLKGKCAIIDSDNDGVNDDNDIDDDNDGVLDLDESTCLNNFAGFVPENFLIFKYDLGPNDYLTSTKDLPSNKLALIGTYFPIVPGTINWSLTDASSHVSTYVPSGQYLFKNGYMTEPNINITIFRVIVPPGFSNVSQSITRYYVDGGTNIWKNGVMIAGMCCGDEGGPPAPITTTYTVNTGDTIEFRSFNGRPVHQSTSFEFTKITGGCIIPDDFDTDGDGIVNRLDTDSDGDGCSDAFESGCTLSKTPSNYTFSGPFGTNGYKDSLETSPESGNIIYNLTYQQATDSTYALCDCPFGINGPLPADTISFCENATINAGSGFNYTWKDGSTSQILYTNQTGKTFVYVGKPGCHYTDTLFVHVLSAELNVKDTVLCLGNDIELNVNLSTINGYPDLTPTINWNGIQNNSLKFVPIKDTLIYCTLTNKLITCIDSTNIQIKSATAKINQLSQPLCFTDSILLQANSNVSYQWNISSATNASIKVPTSTQLIILNIIDTLGCSASDTLQLNYQLTPIKWNANKVNISCFRSQDGTINSNPSGGLLPYSITWSNGGSTNSLQNLDTGSYKLTLTDAMGCIKDTTFFIKEPAQLLAKSAFKKDIQCPPDSNGIIDITTLGGTTPYRFNWLSGQLTEDISNLKSGNYSLKITDLNGCQAVYNDSIKPLHNLPIIKTGNDTSICFQDSILLNATGAITYNWNPSGTNQQYITPPIGINQFIVKGTDINNCQSSDTLKIIVHDLPKVYAGKDTFLCEGNTTKLVGSGTAINYQWNNGITDNQPFNIITGNKTYILTGTDLNHCSNTDTIKINVYPYPNFDLFISDTIGCTPLKTNFQLNAHNAFSNFNWYLDGVKIDSTHTFFQKTFNNTGCYSIDLEVNNKGCVLKKANTICVIPNPNADFIVDTVYVDVQSPTVQFVNLSTNSDTYFWNFDDYSTSTLTNPVHTFPSIVNDYTVRLEASNSKYNCIDNHSILIKVRDEMLIYCPNTFTPDEDKINEVFIPIITKGISQENYTFSIFDRWGIVIFETNNISQGWDGTLNGKTVQSGIYPYVIWFKDNEKGKIHRLDGHVSLIR